MFQFDRVERYEYEITSFGRPGTLVVDVESVADGVATVRLDTSIEGEGSVTRTYEVPAGDSDAFIDAAEEEAYTGAVFILQSEDATLAFIEEDIEWAVGNEFENPLIFGNTTVVGRETIAGVECLTYETYSEDTLIQDGCVTEDLELAVAYTQYGTDEIRMAIRLVDYQQG